MNQQEINHILDDLEAKAERDIEIVFARRLKTLTNTIALIKR